MNIEKVTQEIVAAKKKVQLGPSAFAEIDMKGDSAKIKIDAEIRHGGMSVNDIVKELNKVWKKIDIDA